MNKNYNFYPFTYEGKTLRKDNKFILQHGSGHFCGYVTFHKRDIPKAWWGNYDADALHYLNIHGGITYCKKEDNYIVFGFDCAHSGDDTNPKLKDINYIMRLAEQMEEQIMEYKKVIKKWRKYGFKRRCRLLDEITGKGRIKEESSFGKNIDMLSGCQDLRK